MRAWNGWYHVSGSTYGTWIPGEPRGWRTRWHREHVEGDHRNPPPPGKYEQRHRSARRRTKEPPVYLDHGQRKVAVEAIVEKLTEIGIEVLVASTDSMHYHVLGRFTDDEVRGPTGRAKKHASFALRAWGLPGTVWAKKCHALPIADRSHQVNVFHYIRDHVNEGAWVWTFREGLIPPKAHG